MSVSRKLVRFSIMQRKFSCYSTVVFRFMENRIRPYLSYKSGGVISHMIAGFLQYRENCAIYCLFYCPYEIMRRYFFNIFLEAQFKLNFSVKTRVHTYYIITRGKIRKNDLYLVSRQKITSFFFFFQ